jgi:heme o synthase
MDPRAAAGQRACSLAAEYVRLTKPRVISLLLVTTLCAMIVADGGSPGAFVVLWTMIGGYLSAGGANAINMWFDRDIDARMRRTTGRPVVSGSVSPRQALIFGIALAVASTLILGLLVNWLASGLALVGLLLYVFLYTLWLKRSTTHNIVIGGAAGAVPPLVGWAAATGEIAFGAVLMFAIVFFWTPPHFWALALILRPDYAEAGVPMLPVVRGDAETRHQVLTWTLVMVGVTLLPYVAGVAGVIYLVAAIVLGAVFTGFSVELYRRKTLSCARWTFHISMLYLALLFVAWVIDAI